MDPIRVFPYGPAAYVKPHIKAGHHGTQFGEMVNG
jgi:hypothetical protein